VQHPVLPHPGPVTATTYQPAGASVTAAADGYAQVWTVLDGQISGAPGPVSTVALASSGQNSAVLAEREGVDGRYAQPRAVPREPGELVRDVPQADCRVAAASGGHADAGEPVIVAHPARPR
jgi:hypothetical protein